MRLDQFETLAPAQQELMLLEEELRRERGRKFFRMFPDRGKLRRELYPKHVKFFAFGARARVRAFMAANRIGKTIAGCYELVCHMTGRYPDWWVGKRFNRPVKVWIAGETGKLVRTGLQQKLLGEYTELGTGLIPGVDLINTTPKQGVPESIDTFTVKHANGGVSRAEFKSYDQRAESFASAEIDVILLDEEPPEDVMGECVMRTATTGGVIMLTFTPLKGTSAVVSRFITNGVPIEGMVAAKPDEKYPPSRALIGASWEDVPHLSEQAKSEILAEFPEEHLRAARTKGMPFLGSGAVFQGIAEDDLLLDPIDIPGAWVRIGGMDFGTSHPWAAVELCWDRDLDRIVVTKDFRQSRLTPAMAKIALQPWESFSWLSWAWPADGLQHEKSSNKPLKDHYAEAGFTMLDEHAQFPDGSVGVEAGVMQMLERMQTGRWKVFRTCNYWREEFRTYHRENGIIVKLADDVISASRYAYMMRRYGSTPPVGRGHKLQIPKGWKQA